MNNETTITYQNKDVISKLFGENMKGKSLALLGLNSSLKVTDSKPIHIPMLETNELCISHVFELEDSSIAILDCEDTYNESHFIKYGFSVLNVAESYQKEGKYPDIHMIVLYAADIEEDSACFHRTACDIRIEPVFLSGIDLDAWTKEIKTGIKHQTITDELLMHFILLPLTYKGKEAKQSVIKECVELAMQIEDRNKKTFALAGILAFTDKIVSDETRSQINDRLSITKI